MIGGKHAGPSRIFPVRVMQFTFWFFMLGIVAGADCETGYRWAIVSFSYRRVVFLKNAGEKA